MRRTPSHLERVAREFGRGTLVIVYLDPARPRDMAWATVELLAATCRTSTSSSTSRSTVSCGQFPDRMGAMQKLAPPRLPRTPGSAPAHAVGSHPLTQRRWDDPGNPRLLRRTARALDSGSQDVEASTTRPACRITTCSTRPATPWVSICGIEPTLPTCQRHRCSTCSGRPGLEHSRSLWVC